MDEKFLDNLSEELAREGVVHNRTTMEFGEDGNVWVGAPGGGFWVILEEKK
jgi:hypothetical protein